MGIKEKIFENQANSKVLALMKVSPSSNLYRWNDGQIAFEGDYIFFDDYAEALPIETKYRLGIHCILVNEQNGLIFGWLWGRLTVVFRCDFQKTNIKNRDTIRQAATLDGDVDFRDLGENWAMLYHFVEEEQKAINHAYQLSF